MSKYIKDNLQVNYYFKKIICQESRLAILLPCWIGAAPDNTCLWLGVESVHREYTKPLHRGTWLESVDSIHLFGWSATIVLLWFPSIIVRLISTYHYIVWNLQVITFRLKSQIKKHKKYWYVPITEKTKSHKM